MTNGKNDRINELITRHLAGETTAAGEKELLAWIDLSEKNRQYYDDLKKAFDLTAHHLAFPTSTGIDVDVDHEWDRFRERVGQGTQIRRLGLDRFWMRIAATLLIVMATAGILYFLNMPVNTVYQTASIPKTVTLPDGSQIALNANSVLAVDKDFGEKNRTIALKGEAFFQVEHDAAKPFIVVTDKARIQVVGTSFNVTAYDSLAEMEVVVKTGVVTLESTNGDQKVKLVAGQKGVFSKSMGKIASSVNTDINFLSWNTRHIVFEEKGLRAVMETLEKAYRADIILPNDIPISCTVTVTFDHQSLESVLKVLERTLNLKYTIQGNKVEITEAGC